MKILIYDIKCGVVKRKVMQCIVLLFSILSFFYFKNDLQLYFKATNIKIDEISFMDIFVNFFWGMKDFDSKIEDYFYVPFFNFAFSLLMTYYVGDYSKRQLSGYGKNIITRVERKGDWWTSKFIVAFLQILVCHCILIFSMIIGILILNRGRFNFAADNVIIRRNIKSYNISISSMLIWLSLSIIGSFVVCLVQVLTSILTNSIYSYIMVVSIYVLSYFCTSVFLVGNHMNIARSSMIGGSIYPIEAFAFDIIVIVVLFFIGRIYLKNKDIF